VTAPALTDRDFLGLHCGDCIPWLRSLPGGYAQICVTSPPYNAGIDYGEGICDQRPWPEYEDWARLWMAEIPRVLCEGGRLAINVASYIGRSPAYPLEAFYTLLGVQAGLLLRGGIIWDKGAAQKNSTAWGTWCSPSNPCLRDHQESILVFSKGRFDLPNPRGAKSDLCSSEFTFGTSNLWRVNPETNRTHPAAFPVELAGRLIKLYSWPGDMVLDPFAGSGSTGVAAHNLGRMFAGCELSPVYAKLIEERLRRARAQGRLLESI